MIIVGLSIHTHKRNLMLLNYIESTCQYTMRCVHKQDIQIITVTRLLNVHKTSLFMKRNILAAMQNVLRIYRSLV